MFFRNRNSIPPVATTRDLRVDAVAFAIMLVLVAAEFVFLDPPRWSAALVIAALAVMTAIMTTTIRKYRYWRRHPTLLNLFRRIGDQATRMYNNGHPFDVQPEPVVAYLHRADDAAGDAVIAVRRRFTWRGHAWYLVSRNLAENVEEVESALAEGRTAVMFGETFIVHPGQVVLAFHESETLTVDADGSLSVRHPDYGSLWRRFRTARALLRSGYVFLSESETAALAEQLERSEPIDPEPEN